VSNAKLDATQYTLAMSLVGTVTPWGITHVVKGEWSYGPRANKSLCGRTLNGNAQYMSGADIEVTCKSCGKAWDAMEAKRQASEAADLIASRAHHANTLKLMDVRPVATQVIGDKRTMGDGIVDARCNEHVDYYATGVTIYAGTDFSCTYCGDAWKDGLSSYVIF
jgi:hypothetical protein